jgi:hypothetical protein
MSRPKLPNIPQRPVRPGGFPTTGASSGSTPPPAGQDTTFTDIIKNTLAGWGLSDLADLVDQLGRTGASSDEINLKLQQSDAWKKRFSGNELRKQNGLGVLDPATYIAMEGQYKQILRDLPPGFYDNHDSLANWIGGDVSASELSQRVADANQAYVMAPQAYRDAWDKYYGAAGTGGAIAAILDTSVAEPLIHQKVTAAGIGGAALQQGLALTSNATAVKAAQQGVTIDSARQTYQQIAARLQSDQSIGGRFGQSFGQTDEETANLLGDAGTQNRQGQLYAQESAQFGGRGGASDQGGNNPGANY